MIEAQEVNQNQDLGNAGYTPVESVKSERSFTQHDVDGIVKKAKNDAVESFKKMQLERPDYLAQKHPDAYIPQNNQSHQTMSEDNYRRIAAEEAQRLRDTWMKEAQAKSQEERAHQTLQNFYQKVNTAKTKYQDFDKVTGDIDLSRFPNVIQLLGDYLDNSGDVLYHFGNDRIKMAQLEMLCQTSPQDAVIAAKRLAESLKLNEEASNIQLPREPLGQMRPSNNGTGKTGALTVSELRRKIKV